jgi:hypothetical protein
LQTSPSVTHPHSPPQPSLKHSFSALHVGVQSPLAFDFELQPTLVRQTSNNKAEQIHVQADLPRVSR